MHAIDSICLNRLPEIYLHGLHRRTTLRLNWWYVQLKYSRGLLDLISGQRFTPSGTRKNTMILDFRHTKALMSSNWRAYNFSAKLEPNVKKIYSLKTLYHVSTVLSWIRPQIYDALF